MGKHRHFAARPIMSKISKDAEKKAGYEARKVRPYTNTTCYCRGRRVDLLRTPPAGRRVSLTDLGLQIKPAFSQDELPWIQNLVDGLAKDGLLDCTIDGVRLP